MNTLRVINGVADHLMVRLPEWANGVALFLYGATLLMPGLTFDNPSYSVMKQVAAENTWGFILAGLGATRILALVIDATVPGLMFWALRARALIAVVFCFAWMALSLSLYLANHLSPGSKTYAALLGVDMICAVYLSRQVDRQGRGHWIARL